MYTVYILHSEELDRYYIGFTGNDMSIRMQKHLAKHKGFTGKNTDWQIVYTEKCIEKKEALKREKEIKSWKSKKND